jgi:hypothetical protein
MDVNHAKPPALEWDAYGLEPGVDSGNCAFSKRGSCVGAGLVHASRVIPGCNSKAARFCVAGLAVWLSHSRWCHSFSQGEAGRVDLNHAPPDSCT